MTASPNPTLAELAVTYPAASRVFYSLGLDYCCGGQRPFPDACTERGLDPERVLDRIRAEAPDVTSGTWAERPLADLVRFLVSHYHERLRAELPELVILADKVERRHADKSTCPRGLSDHLRHLHAAVLEHLDKEEQVLFPMILGSNRGPVDAPIHVMEMEHQDHGANLRRTRELTTDLVPPSEACTSWRALYLRLGELERELMEHIHLENNVLFRRALCE